MYIFIHINGTYHGGVLVESKLFEQVLNSQLHVDLRCETPAQYLCCVGGASE